LDCDSLLSDAAIVWTGKRDLPFRLVDRDTEDCDCGTDAVRGTTARRAVMDLAILAAGVKTARPQGSDKALAMVETLNTGRWRGGLCDRDAARDVEKQKGRRAKARNEIDLKKIFFCFCDQSHGQQKS
jgi:hypothetical protein